MNASSFAPGNTGVGYSVEDRIARPVRVSSVPTHCTLALTTLLSQLPCDRCLSMGLSCNFQDRPGARACTACHEKHAQCQTTTRPGPSSWGTEAPTTALRPSSPSSGLYEQRVLYALLQEVKQFREDMRLSREVCQEDMRLHQEHWEDVRVYLEECREDMRLFREERLEDMRLRDERRREERREDRVFFGSLLTKITKIHTRSVTGSRFLGRFK
jgi:hypothetical protein